MYLSALASGSSGSSTRIFSTHALSITIDQGRVWGNSDSHAPLPSPRTQSRLWHRPNGSLPRQFSTRAHNLYLPRRLILNGPARPGKRRCSSIYQRSYCSDPRGITEMLASHLMEPPPSAVRYSDSKQYGAKLSEGPCLISGPHVRLRYDLDKVESLTC